MLVKVRPPRTAQISELQFEKERNCGGQLGNLFFFFFVVLHFNCFHKIRWGAITYASRTENGTNVTRQYKVKLILRKERVRDESHGCAVSHGGRVTLNLMGNSVHPLK